MARFAVAPALQNGFLFFNEHDPVPFRVREVGLLQQFVVEMKMAGQKKDGGLFMKSPLTDWDMEDVMIAACNLRSELLLTSSSSVTVPEFGVRCSTGPRREVWVGEKTFETIEEVLTLARRYLL